MSCMGEYEDRFNICPHCGYARGTTAAEPHHMQPETILHKKYIVGKVLGFGGFGVTYIGWDAMLNTKVAIKEYLPSEFATRIPGHTEVSVYEGQSRGFFDSGLHSFVEEAQRLAKFSSEDGIVRIYDTFTENNTAYIVMEYLDGETVAGMIKRNGPLSYDDSMRIIVPVLSALEKVHQVGIIHRDISPDNIFVTNDGKVKILDFGSARYATAYNSKSLSVIVKRGYAPPEQYIKNAPQGPWSDNYAVAATLYKMLTGTTPVESIDRKDVALIPPANKGANIPLPCQNALMNALNLNPQNRPQTAGEFRQGLVSGQEIIKEEKEKDKTVFPLWLKILSGAVAALVVVIGALFATGTLEMINGKLVFDSPFSNSDEVNVPDVIKKTKKDAKEILEDEGLNLLVVGKKAFEEDIEKDLICEQTPDGGEKIEKDSTVKVKISGGPEVGYVPPAVYYTEDAAVDNFEDEGLKVNVSEEYSDEVGKGGVISQSNAEGTEVSKKKDATDIVVSKGPKNKTYTGSIKLGDLVGKDFETARKELLSQGVYLLIKEAKYDDSARENSIMAQNTAPGKTVKKGSNVYVTISLGKEKVRVPDLEYLSERDAKDALEDIGLEAIVRDGYDETVEEGLVLTQSVEKGELVVKGSAVTITVNREYEPEEEEEEETEVVTTIHFGTISGKVVEKKSGDKVPGVEIEVVMESDPSVVIRTVKTNSSGRYTIELEEGRYILNMSKSGYEDLSASVTVTANESVTVSTAKMVKFETEGAIIGSVIDSTNNAVLSNVTIKIVKASNTSAVVKTITTNSSGNYSVKLEAGNYVLKMTRNGYNPLNMSVSVQADRTTTAATAKMVRSVTKGTVSGSVVDASSSYGISGVTIDIIKSTGTAVVKTITTNYAGNFSVELDAGNYIFKMSKRDYNNLSMYVTVEAGRNITTETARMVKRVAETSSVSGIIRNALDGQPVSGATIRVRRGLNTTSGEYLSYSTTTNSSGRYTLTLPAGSYTLQVSKSNFINAYITVSVAGETIADADTAISPVVESGNIRIVLTWSSQPSDLDSHLVYSDSNGSTRHVYYRSAAGSYNGSSAVVLDTDERYGYGPETITISQSNATEYKYTVRNYSGSPSITESNAKVVVYSGNSIVGTYYVPTTGTGRTWDVFKIVNGQIVPINAITNDSIGELFS